MTTLLFIVGIVILFFGMISFVVPDIDLIRGPAFFISWLVTELAPQIVVIDTVILTVLVMLGGYKNLFGILGVILIVINIFILAYHIRNSLRAAAILERTLAENITVLESESVEQVFRANCKKVVTGRIFPFPIKPRAIQKTKNISYCDDELKRHKLDIYAEKISITESNDSQSSKLKPVVLVVHGGAWIIGQKENQGLPHIHTLAKNGYVCVTINYRLSPKATWPDHIVDVKAALVWIKQNVENFGGDKDRIALLGMSAGGHLVSLAALSFNDPEYQPGFEDADTSFKACVPIYPVLDLTNSLKVQTRQLISMVSKYVFKSSLRQDRTRWESASPLLRDMSQGPDMFILHGNKDLLVPIEESIEFVEKYRSSGNVICFANLTGAQHAFEIFWSIRSRKSVAAVMTFLDFML